MCGAVSPVPMYLAPMHSDNCTFHFYCSHAPLSLCANWQGSVGEQTVIMTELTSCELCLYHSAGAVSCDCVAVCNLLLTVLEIWKLWLWRAWKIILNCTWWIHISVTTTGTVQLPCLLTACMSVTLLLLSCVTVIFVHFHNILKNNY
jgi:hypothetical protein